ncbi:alpha-amylase family glycosyl hydrolase [Streptomyces sp. NPDC001811]
MRAAHPATRPGDESRDRAYAAPGGHPAGDAEAETAPAGTAPRSGADGGPWWRDAVCYELYPRSFADGDGDGTGDLRGATARLDHLAALGVDAVWITPFYPSPLADGGYDISDHTAVAPELGTLDDWDALTARAHALGLRVLVDLVPNHTSAAHPWFREALAAPAGDEARDRYVFRDGRGPGGLTPPNDWLSAFGGPAWTRVPGDGPGTGDAQWYLHLHTPHQPDLNWRNPVVAAEFERIIRFWLDHGADGFRVDVAHTLFKAHGLPDAGHGQHTEPHRNHLMPYHDQEELHPLYRRWRAVLDSHPGADGTAAVGERLLVGEVILFDQRRLARYVRPGEMGHVLNFAWTDAPWEGRALRAVIEDTVAATDAVGAPATWTLSSHDTPRPVSRFGGGERGARRARAAALLTLALPGAAYVYQGEELGLPQAHVAEDRRRDPVWELSGHTDQGRDGCRVPLPWQGRTSPYGFSEAPPEDCWFPPPDDWAPLTVDAQHRDPGSVLSLYRAALRLRRAHPPRRTGGLRLLGPESGEWLGFDRGPGLRCLVNFGPAALPLDPADEVLLSSEPLHGHLLPPDTTVWLRPGPR